MIQKVISLENVYNKKLITLTKGKIYDVIEIDGYWIVVKNNQGVEASFLINRFEDIEKHRNKTIDNILK